MSSTTASRTAAAPGQSLATPSTHGRRDLGGTPICQPSPMSGMSAGSSELLPRSQGLQTTPGLSALGEATVGGPPHPCEAAAASPPAATSVPAELLPELKREALELAAYVTAAVPVPSKTLVLALEEKCIKYRAAAAEWERKCTALQNEARQQTTAGAPPPTAPRAHQGRPRRSPSVNVYETMLGSGPAGRGTGIGGRGGGGSPRRSPRSAQSALGLVGIPPTFSASASHGKKRRVTRKNLDREHSSSVHHSIRNPSPLSLLETPCPALLPWHLQTCAAHHSPSSSGRTGLVHLAHSVSLRAVALAPLAGSTSTQTTVQLSQVLASITTLTTERDSLRRQNAALHTQLEQVTDAAGGGAACCP